MIELRASADVIAEHLGVMSDGAGGDRANRPGR